MPLSNNVVCPYCKAEMKEVDKLFTDKPTSSSSKIEVNVVCEKCTTSFKILQFIDVSYYSVIEV